ncbi:hypothetical protein VDR65_10365 [Xanthomonas campestris pv. campestris]|nr:hypothetical protein [Xanthomonas campestris pv. campestris]MEB1724834.1 hypothetical protein [Xanthomonas campestris pv. campestris]MEB1896833.1 hypothetical protein [Xanthomonas campestris pv. campestris]
MNVVKKPSIHYTLVSVDGCERTTSYCPASEGYRDYHDSGWTPGEPEQHTARAELEIDWGGGRHQMLKLEGHQHRDIEMYDKLPELLEAIGSGDQPETALQDALTAASRPAMAG